jgi:hypothetical protein
MAVTAIWPVKGWLGSAVIYVENPDKTENPQYFDKKDMTIVAAQGLSDVIEYAAQDEKARKKYGVEILSGEMEHYVSGINCDPSMAREQMSLVKKEFGKADGTAAFHGYQSFAPGEAAPNTAHEIGVKLAEELWGRDFQVIVATHLDKENHIHNHFVVNSISLTGRRLWNKKSLYYNLRSASDRLCREYSLSVIENPAPGKSKHYAEWYAEQNGKPTWRSIIKTDIDEAIRESMTDTQFFTALKQRGYEIKSGKDISVRPPGKERFFRLARNFGGSYTLESIKSRILSQRSAKMPPGKGSCRKTSYAPILSKGKRRKIGGLLGLYLHYQYLLGNIPKNRSPAPKRTHFLLREDLRRLETINGETRLLLRNGIQTAEQLFMFRDERITEIASLCKDRDKLHRQLRVQTDPDSQSKIKAEIGEKKIALFAIIPDNDTSFNFLVSILYTQLFQKLFQTADCKYGGTLPLHVHFVMDEFANSVTRCSVKSAA